MLTKLLGPPAEPRGAERLRIRRPICQKYRWRTRPNLPPHLSQRFFMPVSCYKICGARMGLVAVVATIKSSHPLEPSIIEGKAFAAICRRTSFVVATCEELQFKLYVHIPSPKVAQYTWSVMLGGCMHA